MWGCMERVKNDCIKSFNMWDIIRKVIVEIVEEFGVEVKEIIFFGLRVRGDFRKDFDWDVLVVIKERILRYVEFELYKLVYRKLLFNGIKVDIFIIFKDEFEKVKDNKVYVYYYVFKEGIKVWVIRSGWRRLKRIWFFFVLVYLKVFMIMLFFMFNNVLKKCWKCF